MGKGSGSVTAFSRADGFVRIGRNTEIVESGSRIDVTLIGRELPLADLVVVGSHCVGSTCSPRHSRAAASGEGDGVGSHGGLAAAERGECDVAPIHLLDPATGRYNDPFLRGDLRLVRGYRRIQGVLTRADETREIAELLSDPALRMVNRNRGSGTRVLIDELLGDRRPPATRTSRARTSRSQRPSPRSAPTGAWRSRRSPARRGCASSRWARSATTSPCPHRVSRVQRCRRSCACSPRTVRCAQRCARSASKSES
jgi:hypothetical protein